MSYPKIIQRLHLVSSSLLILLLSLTICGLLIYQMSAEKKHKAQLIRDRIMSDRTAAIQSVINRTIRDIENDRTICQKTYGEASEQQLILSRPGQSTPPQNPCDEKFLKEMARNRIRATQLPYNGCISIIQILNYEGGKDYGVRLVHPLLPQSEGMLLSTDMVDAKGNLHYLKELEGLKQHGELVQERWLKKDDADGVEHILTFSRLYAKYDWIITTGITLDDIELEISTQMAQVSLRLNKQLVQIFFITLALLIASLGIAYYFHKRIGQTIIFFHREVADREQQLRELNENLESTVENRTLELKESQRYLQSLLTAADNIAFIVFDLQRPYPAITDLSPGGEKIFGHSRLEAIGQPATLILPPDAIETEGKIMQAIQDPVQSHSGDTLLMRGNRENFAALFRTTPQCGPDGNPTGVLGVFIDISELRSTQEALRSSEKRYQTLFDEVVDGIVLADKESGSIIDCNKAMATLLKTSKEELLGTTLQLTFPTDHATGGKAFRLTGKHLGSNDHALIVQLTTAAGTILDTEIKTSLFELQDTSCVLAIVRDITNQKHLNERLLQAQKMESIGTLAGGIAHDFNNILSAIMGFAELAKVSLPPDAAAQDNLEQVLQASRRAANLVDQILAFSRQTSQELIHFQPVPLLKEALKLLRSTIPTTIQIKENISPTDATIYANPTQFHQIFMNLCTNAFQAMEHAGGRLTVSLQQVQYDPVEFPEESHLQDKELLKLAVTDTGPGIPLNIQKRMFDPFFTTREPGEGTGLGLSTVHGIVKDFGGAIRVLSALNEGTTFEIVLPLSKRKRYTIEPEAAEGAPACPVGTERILFIDDEKELTTLGKHILESLGYTVSCCNSASEALLLFNTAPDRYDLVITDYTMPEMNGIDLAESILARDPDMAVILCTGYASTVSKERAEQRGIKGFIMKPFSRRQIAVLIDELLHQPPPEPETTDKQGTT